MGLFSFLKKDNRLKCDYCGRIMENAPYSKHGGTKTYYFCSGSCKKNFRKAGFGKQNSNCPTCGL